MFQSEVGEMGKSNESHESEDIGAKLDAIHETLEKILNLMQSQISRVAADQAFTADMAKRAGEAARKAGEAARREALRRP